jgi:hypothetical protein
MKKEDDDEDEKGDRLIFHLRTLYEIGLRGLFAEWLQNCQTAGYEKVFFLETWKFVYIKLAYFRLAQLRD